MSNDGVADAVLRTMLDARARRAPDAMRPRFTLEPRDGEFERIDLGVVDRERDEASRRIVRVAGQRVSAQIRSGSSRMRVALGRVGLCCRCRGQVRREILECLRVAMSEREIRER